MGENCEKKTGVWCVKQGWCKFGVIKFFFQAEGGIRDAQESRGLGDVYKRQVFDGSNPNAYGVFQLY